MAASEKVAHEIVKQSILSMGRTWPNPTVACAIDLDSDQSQFFSGATEAPGRRHAEIVALDSLDRSGQGLLDAPGSLYVTLEPCTRHGRTPPCVDRILKYPRLTVSIGTLDPTLSGEGIEKLKQSNQFEGLDPALEDIALVFLRGFTQRKPRIHFKAAERGGFIGKKSERVIISGKGALAVSMMLRAKLDAVVVGPGTVRADLPSLDLRDPGERPEFERTSGEDLFLDALLEHWKEVRASTLREPEYQPGRVFILGKRFPGDSDFLKKQMRLSEKGRDAVYCILWNEKNEWNDIPDQNKVNLPPMSQPDFKMEFRSFLQSRGMNEVLIEGGAGLFKALGAESGDRILLFRSQQTDKHDLDVVLPHEFLYGDPRATYKLDQDLLEVRQIP